MAEPDKDFEIRDLLPRERHAEIFDWLCKSLGKTPKQLAAEMLINAVMREKPAYEEAKGGGGGSSRNLEALASRLR